MIACLALAALLVTGCARGPAGGGADKAAAAPPAASPGNSSPAANTPESAAGTAYQVVPDQSEAAYAVGETFLGQRRDVIAVGKTTAFFGSIVLDGGVIQPSTVEVDLTTLKSDQSRRDSQVQRVLDTRNHPRAIYRISGAEGNPVLAEGQEVPIKLQGTMTIKGTDKPLAFDGTAKLEGDTLTLTATATFDMTEFGVNPPNIANFVAVEDEVKLTVTFVGQKQG
ncbi:polyisoprenoid-binding protein YceI [Symbiobacterium terraclitae]|uniref:Polyisoprenoid-binding protein YceI n=1 Tax=Symbiobacterium terraclitae TaxID=557451 RepID=A0ABS4JTI7_9FIRM|nr:YceI family protein [Symbiobacterium terraclitae]MBP2018857.1 polyisoprenoid-binding protein YceI [Symbiobacterium terraclitae]